MKRVILYSEKCIYLAIAVKFHVYTITDGNILPVPFINEGT